MTIPVTTKLDNAALIYPPCRTKKYASLFRMSVCLKENIDAQLLTHALHKVINRFPSFAYRLDSGFFWWYLKRLYNPPELVDNSPLHPFSFKRTGGYMFRVSYSCDTVYLDVFHALTDGTGAMTFLMSLIAEYFRMKNGVCFEYGGYVLDPAEEPNEDEFNDAFRRFSGCRGSLDSNERAYHIKGTVEPYDVLHDVRFIISSLDLSSAAERYDCTVTELLTSLMLRAVQKIHSEDSSRRKSEFIRIEVPVNLRKTFGASTLRNFSSYVFLGLDLRNGPYSLEQVVKEVALQKRLYTLPQRLRTKVAANVALEDNPMIAVIPRMIKKPVMNLINHFKGDSYCTHTLSNMGIVELPPMLEEYIRSVDFILGRSREKSGSCGCVSFAGTTSLNFTRRIKEADFEKYFAQELETCGITYSMLFL